jgi:hypothetical protein
MERQNAEQWDGVKLNELAEAYMEVRRDMWRLLADKVGEKWSLVEQKVYQTPLNRPWRGAIADLITVHGKGHQESHPGSSVKEKGYRPS